MSAAVSCGSPDTKTREKIVGASPGDFWEAPPGLILGGLALTSLMSSSSAGPETGGGAATGLVVGMGVGAIVGLQVVG